MKRNRKAINVDLDVVIIIPHLHKLKIQEQQGIRLTMASTLLTTVFLLGAV